MVKQDRAANGSVTNTTLVTESAIPPKVKEGAGCKLAPSGLQG